MTEAPQRPGPGSVIALVFLGIAVFAVPQLFRQPGFLDLVDGSVRSDGSIATTRIGGRSMLIYTLEYQIPIVDQRQSTSPVYGLAFVEAGNSWDKISQTSVSLKDLKKSAGFGIRVVMPLIGIMGFDFGYGFDAPSDPIQQQTQSRSGWHTHFQLGQTF